MKRYSRLTVFWIFLIYLPASATIINIPYDYETIQEGIDASTDGDTVLVHPRMYVENINFNGHNIVLGSLFLTTGDTTYIFSTIIDGDSSGSVVTFGSGESESAIITGFTIRNGDADVGGGIHFSGFSNPKIGYNIIIDNKARYGGGIYCWHSNPMISNNIISGNEARSGGGIACAFSCPSINYNIITENVALSGNGGGISCSGSHPTIINTTITGNTAFEHGGGIYCDDYSCPMVINSILWADNAEYESEIDFDDSSSPILVYCDVEGGWQGEGNIDIDPLFRDAENGDFHLMSTACGDPYDSPCIDVGHPNILDSLLDCSWGLATELSDMGAFAGGVSVLSGRIIIIPDDYPTIREGLIASMHGDTVLVQPGTYFESIKFIGRKITLGSLFLTTGNTSYISSTIVDGSNTGSPGVAFSSGEDSTSVITGFTIQNFSNEYGGIYCNHSSPTISHNIIKENAADM